jgi:hypothetical protein
MSHTDASGGGRRADLGNVDVESEPSPLGSGGTRGSRSWFYTVFVICNIFGEIPEQWRLLSSSSSGIVADAYTVNSASI